MRVLPKNSKWTLYETNHYDVFDGGKRAGRIQEIFPISPDAKLPGRIFAFSFVTGHDQSLNLKENTVDDAERQILKEWRANRH